MKPHEQKTAHDNPRQRVGADAERQMARYLDRRFKDDSETCLLHALRREDQEQAKQDSVPRVYQIDNLIMNR